MRLFPFLIASALLVSGCGNRAGVKFFQQPSNTQASETTGFPAVVRVISPDGTGLCTGTFISPRAVLTASHCTAHPGNYKIVTDWGVFSTSKVLRYGPGTVSDANDIALLVFATPTADDGANQVIPLTNSVTKGETVTLVGFGCNNLDTLAGMNTKRAGQNQVYQKGDFIQLASPRTSPDGASGVSQSGSPSTSIGRQKILGPDNLSGTCFGDSGGPLLTQTNQGYSVGGVTHGGSWNQEVLFSLYSDVTKSDNWAFLENAENINQLYLTRPCEAPQTKLPQCQTSQAFTGIVDLIKWVLGKLAIWLGI